MTENGIEQTIFRYALAYDKNDMDMLVSCFAEDGVLITPAGAAQHHELRKDDVAFMGGTEPVRGLTAIRAFQAKARNRRSELGHQPRHAITNVRIEHTASGVSVTSYLTLFITQSDGKSFLDHTGLYLDQMVEVHGQWKIKERRISIDSDQNFPGRKNLT